MPKVLVGMSGGVDSAVAAMLLQEQGYKVVGATFLLCPQNTPEDAAAVCRQLGIEHLVLDWRDQFEQEVIQPFIQGYLQGQTPNPCIYCNRAIKFPPFWEVAKAHGCEYIATGHYARTEQREGRFYLKRAASRAKDQSYVLFQLTQELLAHTLFPLGEMESKQQIRKLAAEKGLVVSSKPDSQDICFIPDGDYAAFIARTTGTPPTPGNFVDTQGRVLGQHKGLYHYTIGQRKGLGLALPSHGYVARLDAQNNAVTVTLDESDLFAAGLTAQRANFIYQPRETASLEAKIRYSHPGAPCSLVKTEGESFELQFDTPQRAPTPGQAIVLYEGDYVAGGGIIAGVKY